MTLAAYCDGENFGDREDGKSFRAGWYLVTEDADGNRFNPIGPFPTEAKAYAIHNASFKDE
jgi:hypothetical protein